MEWKHYRHRSRSKDAPGRCKSGFQSDIEPALSLWTHGCQSQSGAKVCYGLASQGGLLYRLSSARIAFLYLFAVLKRTFWQLRIPNDPVRSDLVDSERRTSVIG